MRVKALKSFIGSVPMNIDEIKDVPEETAEDLIKSGHAVEDTNVYGGWEYNEETGLDERTVQSTYIETREHVPSSHTHTLETTIKSATKINSQTCSVITVTSCTDPNCPNPEEVYEETTEVKNHNFVRGEGIDRGEYIEYPTYCEYCNYQGASEYEAKE